MFLTIKYIPIIQLIGMLINNSLYTYDINIEFDYIGDFLLGNSIVNISMLYVCSFTFGFCNWHRHIIGFHKVFDHVEAHDKDTFWDAMKEFHECVKGEHFDETYAMYQVSNMYHTKANGVVCRGQIFTVEDAKAIYDKHVRNINREITYWDVYVAVNAQYHDYIRMYKQWFPNLTEEQLDEKIIHSAINFWFEDEDAGSGKVWNYFKDI